MCSAIGQTKVFIVEDDPLFLASVQAMLSNAGYEVSASTSSTDTSLPLEFRQADLIVLDLGLPDRDGFEVLQSIRSNPATATKPVLMLTAHDPMQYRLRGLALGADDYIIKPPNRAELLLRIEGLLRRAGCARAAEDDSARVVVDHPGSGVGFINAREITHIAAARNYCYVHTRDDKKLTSRSIGELENQLAEKFVRAHRSYLINPDKVRSAKWLDNSTYVLEMDCEDETLIPVSRAHRNTVRQALGLEAGIAAATA